MDIDMVLMEDMQHQRSMQKDPDVLFCLSMVDKFKQLSVEQKELAQLEVLQVMMRARMSQNPPPIPICSEAPFNFQPQQYSANTSANTPATQTMYSSNYTPIYHQLSSYKG